MKTLESDSNVNPSVEEHSSIQQTFMFIENCENDIHITIKRGQRARIYIEDNPLESTLTRKIPRTEPYSEINNRDNQLFDRLRNFGTEVETRTKGIQTPWMGNFCRLDSYDILNTKDATLERSIDFALPTKSRDAHLIDELTGTVNSLNEKVKGMNVYKQSPFACLFGITFSLLVLSFIFLFLGFIKIGALFGFTFMAMLFIMLYALWRINDIILIRPQVIVLGFMAALGLVATSVVSLFT